VAQRVVGDILTAMGRHRPTLKGGEEVVEMTERVTYETVSDDEELRQRAVKRLEDKRELVTNTVAYVSVNAALVVIWWVTGASFFWPVFPILGWGIGLALHAWTVLWPAAGERQIQAEMQRLRHDGH
jgi:2TM domain